MKERAMTSREWTALAALAGLLLTTGMGGAATSADKCAAAKLAAASRKATRQLACYAAALKRGTAVDPACLARADARFATAFARAEAKGECPIPGDAASVEGDVDACVVQLVSDTPPECAGALEDCSAIPCCPARGLACQGGVCCGASGAGCGVGFPPCCSGACSGGTCG
jgi:hypothetical protein